MSTVHLSANNCIAELGWSPKENTWRWYLTWEDGSPWGTHCHNGVASSKEKARADLVKLMIYIEDYWPKLEYFQFLA